MKNLAYLYRSFANLLSALIKKSSISAGLPASLREYRPREHYKAISFVALASIIGCPTVAQNVETSRAIYKSGVERIAASDRLRALSQEMSTAACLVDAAVSVDKNKAIIAKSVSEFDTTITALKVGRADLGIDTVEENRKMLAAINGLSLQWEHLRTAAQLRMVEAVIDEQVDFLSRQNINTMYAAKYLVVETVNTYAVPPALLQSDAFTINILARQRSLSQQIAKELCGLATGNNTLGNQARLNNAAKLFNASHQALINGFPQAGVIAPTNDTSRRLLGEIGLNWLDIREGLKTAGQQQDINAVVPLIESLRALREPLDALVQIYSNESKSGI